MDIELERQVEALFQELVNLTSAHRERMINERCADLTALRQRVERLLALHDASCPRLPTPATLLPQEATTRPPVPHPQRIGHFQILRQLGEGGMGVVYLAEQTQPIHRQVALKIIKLGMDTKSVIARFETERESLALMDHPNVARVIDAGTTEQGRPYFVMEYVEGVPITDFCDDMRLTLAQRLNLFMQICLAVQHAHQKGIIHRDLKPSNVLVTLVDQQPRVKVIDFGIAKATQQKLTEHTFATEQGILVGTPAYMSPEQADRLGQDIDTRADIYSLGVILYELLVGALPLAPDVLRQAALSEVQRMIREVDPPKPSSRVGPADRTSSSVKSNNVSDQQSASHTIAARRRTDPKSLYRQVRGDLDWIVMKCLEKDRARRYDTANALVMEIQRYLNNEPVTAGPPSRTYRFKKFIRRNRASVGTAAIIVLVLSGGLVGTSVMFLRAQAAETRERSERVRAEEGETHAQEAGAEAEQVIQFLTDMLAAVGPWQQGKEVTVREVLDKSAEGISEKFSGKPLIEGRLQLTLGQTYYSLGLVDPAEQHLAQAAVIYARVVGPEDPRTLSAVTTHARVIKDRGNYDQAEAVVRGALEIQRRVRGEDHPETLRSMLLLAIIVGRQGHYGEAAELYRETLQTRLRVLGADHLDTLACMEGLANTLSQQGRWVEAEELYHKTLEGLRRVVGAEHPNVLGVMRNLASNLNLQGRHAQAEELFRKTLEMDLRVLGAEHPDTIASMQGLARNLYQQGRYPEAEVLFGRTVVDLRRTLGAENPQTLWSMHHLASTMHRRGRFAEAEELHRETLEISRRVLGEEHPRTIQSMNALANSIAEQGRRTEAQELLQKAFVLARRVLGDDHPDTLWYMNNLASNFANQGRHAEAEDLYRKILGIQRRVLTDHDPGAAETLYRLAAVLEATQQWSEAEPPCREAGLILASQLPAEHRDRQANSNLLGKILCGQGRYAEAEPLLLESYQALRDHPSFTVEAKKELLESMVWLYDSWHAAKPGQGYDAKAAEYRSLIEQSHKQE